MTDLELANALVDQYGRQIVDLAAKVQSAWDADGYEPSDDEITNPTCRLCGFELTNHSELIDDVCVVCFQKRRKAVA